MRRTVKLRNSDGTKTLAEQCTTCQRFFVPSAIANHISTCSISHQITELEDPLVCNAPECVLHEETQKVIDTSHLGPPVVDRCRFCFKTFLKTAIPQHFADSHSEEILREKQGKPRKDRPGLISRFRHRSIVCRFCKLPFPNRKAWEKHMVEVGNHGGGFQCTTCSMTFRTEHGLRAHKNKHLKRFQCSVCHMYLSSAASLRTHMLKHTGLNPHKCQLCKKTFRYASSLGHHMMTHEEKKIVCQFCGKKFTFSFNYTKHLEVRHADPKDKLVCEHCGGLFVKSKMKDHLATHGEATLPCEVCGKKFKIKDHLRKHRLRVHKRELQLLTCPICAAAFSRPEYLQNHMTFKHPLVQDPTVSYTGAATGTGSAQPTPPSTNMLDRLQPTPSTASILERLQQAYRPYENC